jgi:hypothetical protein
MSAPLHIINRIFPPKFSMTVYYIPTCIVLGRSLLYTYMYCFGALLIIYLHVLFWGAPTLGTFHPFFSFHGSILFLGFRFPCSPSGSRKRTRRPRSKRLRWRKPLDEVVSHCHVLGPISRN